MLKGLKVINKNNKDNQLFSIRNSVLVWVAGIMLGWGIAVIGVYQWIKTSNNGPVINSAAPIVAHGNEARSRDGKRLSEIAPAAGKPSDKPEGNK